MIIDASLDEGVQRALNNLEQKDFDRSVSYAYEHEILWYGVEAITHVVVMRAALENLRKKRSGAYFAKTCGLAFGEEQFGFSIDAREIRSLGVYIPSQKLPKDDEKRITLFYYDHKNRIHSKDWKGDRRDSLELVSRKWVPSDFHNVQLMRQGARFGKNMWETCVLGFERYKEGDGNMKPQPEHVTKLASQLIAYYSAIIGYR